MSFTSYHLIIEGQFYGTYWSHKAMQLAIENAKNEGKRWEIKTSQIKT